MTKSDKKKCFHLSKKSLRTRWLLYFQSGWFVWSLCLLPLKSLGATLLISSSQSLRWINQVSFRIQAWSDIKFYKLPVVHKQKRTYFNNLICNEDLKMAVQFEKNISLNISFYPRSLEIKFDDNLPFQLFLEIHSISNYKVAE